MQRYQYLALLLRGEGASCAAGSECTTTSPPLSPQGTCQSVGNDCVVAKLTILSPQGPCVLFATPGMLHGGASLEAFKAWAGGPLNLVILPGYQVRFRFEGYQEGQTRQPSRHASELPAYYPC